MPRMKDLLIAARAKLAQGWCQGSYAVDDHGDATLVSGPGACAWCAEGAILAVTSADGPYHTLHRLVEKHADSHLAHWNDHPGRTQAEVLALFDRAIEACDGA